MVGLEKKINHIKCFIIESTYESNFNSEVNFGLIHNFMNKNNFSLIKIENQKNTKLNIFGNNKDNIPGVADFIYLNNRYLVPKNKNDYNLLSSLLLIVNHNHLLFYILEKYSKKFILSKKNKFFEKLKFNIAHILNEKSKEPYYDYKKANNFFKKIFSENLPAYNKFNESNFYNKN